MDCDSEQSAQDPIKNTQSDGEIDDKEVKEILEIIAGTGKFWHHWDLLKALLSDQLKKVLAEYPESQKEAVTKSQESSLPESYSELSRKLNEVLLSFTEGPPFTLQRLCEILLDPKSTYPKLSKLALALEKNLLVTSTLNICNDPYPGSITRSLPNSSRRVDDERHEKISLEQNGVSSTDGGYADEEMVDAVSDDHNMNIDVKMQEDKVEGTSEICAEPTELNAETAPAKEEAKN